MIADDEAELVRLLTQGGLDRAAADRVARYGALLLAANERLNLTGARDAALLTPHLLDALTLAPFVGDSLIDIGTGGGLPGIPLAIVTGTRLVLVDAIAKKITALRRIVEELGLAADLMVGRAEVLGHDPKLRGTFASATARAVGPPSTVAELTLPFVRIGGNALLQRGGFSETERTALDDAALVLGARRVDEVLTGEDRRIVVLRKEVPTVGRFPRRTGVPAKRPLCV